MSFFPTSSEETGPDEPRVVGLDEEADVVDALASDTAREVLSVLTEEPTTASELAETVDTSVQNVSHHLDKLTACGVVEVVDTVYSERGREMDVYAPTGQPLVIVSGDTDATADVRELLGRLLGGVALLALASLLVQVTTPDAPTPEELRNAAGGVPTPPPPGLVFFAGGLTVLLVWLAVWYVRRER